MCDQFERVKRYALMVPKTTEELLAQGQFMLYANTTFMALMKADILQIIKDAAKISDFSPLSQSTRDTIADTINWLQTIKPIFDQNSSVSLNILAMIY